jgi:hypothetical protein
MVTATHPTNHRHTEADTLMFYVSDTSIRGYWVLNTRAGVTPFAFTENGERFRHFDWALDRHEPGVQLKLGQRYFRERTEEEVQEAARKQVDNLVQGGHLKPDSLQYVIALADMVQAFREVPVLLKRPSLLELAGVSEYQQAA